MHAPVDAGAPLQLSQGVDGGNAPLGQAQHSRGDGDAVLGILPGALKCCSHCEDILASWRVLEWRCC
jgi:hypothetical protein